MFTNETEPEAARKLADELAEHACLELFIEAARQCDAPFRIEPEAAGLELTAVGEIQSGLPNRGRLKIFFPTPKRAVAVFFKRSNLSFSRDRFSYGGVLTRPSRMDRDKPVDWLAYLASGLSPASRPPDLRRALPYTIPD